MAVDALELRPRGPVALFDAAVRLVTTSSGLWALTLPSGAAVVAAGLSLAERILRHGSIALPAAVWTLAWCFRALSQGAACHYAEQQVLGLTEPNVWASWRAALGRAPSLVTTCALMLGVTVLVVVVTAGFGFFFFGAHAVAYAVTMRGQGYPLNVISTSATLLGPSRFAAVMVRCCGTLQLILGLNLHLAVAGSLYLITHLAGFDLTYPSHFVVLTNPVWVTAVALVTFSCFEPIRAATATLLLIDARVRQEGLDLVAAVEQLPSRKKIAAALVLALTVLHSGSAVAAPSALRSRIDRIARQCHMAAKLDRQSLELVDALSEKQRAAASRFVSRVETQASDDHDCEGAQRALREGLAQLRAAKNLEAEVDAEHSRDEAKAILARPEFQVAPAEPEDPEARTDEAPGFWRDWWSTFLKWLQHLLESQPDAAPHPKVDLGGPMAVATVVIVLAVVLIIGIGIFLIVRFTKRDQGGDAEVETSTLEAALSNDPMSALSRPAGTWASLADELAARGEFREAIRHLYLALLARLHVEGRISYDTTRSNWEYLRELKGTAALLAAFRELTRRFDFAWYGHLLVDSAAYDTFRELTGPWLTETASEHRA